MKVELSKWFRLTDGEVPQLYSLVITSRYDVEVVELKACYPVTVGPIHKCFVNVKQNHTNRCSLWSLTGDILICDISQPMQHWRQKYRLPKRPSFATFLWWIEPFSCRERQTECKLAQGEDSSKSSTCFLSWWVTLMGSVAANFQRQFNITAGEAGENLWTVNAILYNSWHETQHKALIKGIYCARHWSLLWGRLLILCSVLI